MPSRTGTRIYTPTTTVSVRLRCLACGREETVEVATRGRLAGMTKEQRAILDLFVTTHHAAQVVT